MIQLSSSFYLKHQKEARRAQATHKTLIASVIWQLRQKNNSLLGHRNKIFSSGSCIDKRVHKRFFNLLMGALHAEDMGAIKPNEELTVSYRLAYLETASGSPYFNLLSHLT